MEKSSNKTIEIKCPEFTATKLIGKHNQFLCVYGTTFLHSTRRNNKEKLVGLQGFLN